MREAKRSPELWEGGKRYAFPAFPQLLLLNKVESINPDTSGKHQPGRSAISAVSDARFHKQVAFLRIRNYVAMHIIREGLSMRRLSVVISGYTGYLEVVRITQE